MSAPHDHDHTPARFDRAFAIGIALNLGFVAVEAFYGWKVDSLALLADAGHNLSDVAGHSARRAEPSDSVNRP